MRRHIRENVLPLMVMIVFSLATVFSARQLINHTAQLHERYFTSHAAAQDLGRAFNDFEAVFLSYLATDTNYTEKDLRHSIHYLKKMYDRLYRAIKTNQVDPQFLVHADGLKTDIAIMEGFFSTKDTQSKEHRNAAAIAALYQIHTTLSDLGYDLILDHNNNFNSDEMNQHRYLLYGYVFMMALSGIVLIVLLVFKIDRLEEAGEDKEVTVKTLEDRLAAIELAGDGIGISEADGHLSFVNRAFVETYGYNSWQSMIGRSWLDFCADDIRSTLEREVFSSLGTGASWSGIGTGVRKDGSVFRKSISIAALPRDRWIFVVHDVTDSIKTEELAQHRLAAIEAAGDGIGIADAKGNLTYMNYALKTLHELDEYQAQDMIGKPWVDLYNDSGRNNIRGDVLPALSKQGYWKGESPILTKSGRMVHAELTLTSLTDGGLIGTARDITDRIKAEHERVELEKQFYQAQKMEAVGRLAGGIAHDFNNILAAMMGYAEFLLDDLPRESDQHRYARAVLEGGLQARDVIDRLLMYSKTHDHKIEILDLGKKIKGVISILRSSIPVTIDIQYEGQLSGFVVRGNKTLISQAVMNLCVNARDAITSEHGLIKIDIQKQTYEGLSLSYHVLGELEKGRDYYAFSILDNGSGMSAGVMERIFDPFFTTKSVDHGTGLGLSSVHGIMASHHGAVAVKSIEGEGTEFILFFPVADEKVLAQETEQKYEGEIVSIAQDQHIMVVDDQEDVLMMMAEMLGRMGFAAELHAEAATALESLAADPERCAVVITDQTMPGMIGTEMAKIIEKTYAEIPIILMSGFAAENLSALTADISAIVSILHKPLNRNDVARAVSQALLGRRLVA